MTEKKQGFIDTIASYPATFWVANTMEIFERMAWYGWFTVMALYVTGSVATGGLGFTTETRGMLMAVVPCILYLLPVVTGALADRYGFKRTFIIAYSMMIVAYYLLGQFHTLPTFFLAFLFVAVAAATFKPVVVGTVAKVTDESNSSLGFGIFYMMVNIGGFVGPIIAGIVRGWGWEYVFFACSAWAFVNLLVVLFLYQEPKVEGAAADRRTLRKVGDDLVEVLGNIRFFITVGTVIVGLMVSSALSSIEASWFSWGGFGLATVAWLVLNFVWDLVLPAGSGDPKSPMGQGRSPLGRRMHCSNWRFALFLLIMSGFWTSFNQIFYTMPEYIRDFTDTRPLINLAESVFGKDTSGDPDKGVASVVATVSKEERVVITERVASLRAAGGSGPNADRNLLWLLPEDEFKRIVDAAPQDIKDRLEEEVEAEAAPESEASEEPESSNETPPAEPKLKALSDADIAKLTAIAAEMHGPNSRENLIRLAHENSSETLLGTKVRIGPKALDAAISQSDDDAKVAAAIIIGHRQVNPEFIVNIDAGAIIIFQVLISFLMARFHRFTTMIVGMLIAAVGIGLSFIAGDDGLLGGGGSVWIVALGLFTFAIGEMMASPTSQEYVGRIAPKNKIALYMGYYFVAVALGNLFGGILSGQLYGTLARDMQRPDLMWLAFGAIMLATTIVFVLYNKFALPKHKADTLTPA